MLFGEDFSAFFVEKRCVFVNMDQFCSNTDEPKTVDDIHEALRATVIDPSHFPPLMRAYDSKMRREENKGAFDRKVVAEICRQGGEGSLSAEERLKELFAEVRERSLETGGRGVLAGTYRSPHTLPHMDGEKVIGEESWQKLKEVFVQIEDLSSKMKIKNSGVEIISPPIFAEGKFFQGIEDAKNWIRTLLDLASETPDIVDFEGALNKILRDLESFNSPKERS